MTDTPKKMESYKVWKHRYLELLKEYNIVESRLTEEKIEIENLNEQIIELEDSNIQKDMKIEELEMENYYYKDALDEVEENLKIQKKRKIEARREISELKSGINDLINENLKFITLLNENNISYSEEDESKCCKLCYNGLDEKQEKNFKCTNKNCSKQFHIKCLIKIKNNKNLCPYCKVEYKGYDFNKFLDEDYYYESEDDTVEIEYNRNYNLEVEDFRLPYYTDNTDNIEIIKIQKCYRGFIVRRQYKIDKQFKINSENEKEKILKNYPNITNNVLNFEQNIEELNEF